MIYSYLPQTFTYANHYENTNECKKITPYSLIVRLLNTLVNVYVNVLVFTRIAGTSYPEVVDIGVKSYIEIHAI